MLSQAELRKRNKETWESIQGKNGYNPADSKGLQEGYYPEQHYKDLPYEDNSRENDEY